MMQMDLNEQNCRIVLKIQNLTKKINNNENRKLNKCVKDLLIVATNDSLHVIDWSSGLFLLPKLILPFPVT